MVSQWSVPENLDRFRRMLVYRGAGLGRLQLYILCCKLAIPVQKLLKLMIS